MVYVVWALALLSAVIYGDCFTSDELMGNSQPQSVQQMRKGYQHQFYSGPIRDHALRGKTYRNTTAQSHVTCAVLCLQSDKCKSFNYWESSKLCELNWAVYAADKSDLQPSNECYYFDDKFHKECDVIEIPANSNPHKYHHKFMFPRLDSSTKFRLDFAAKGKNDVMFALSEYNNEDQFYEISIAGWWNTQSFIRCGRHCSPTYVTVLTDGLLDEFEYRRFWLSYDNGKMQVGKWGQLDPFMEWYDETRRVQVNYIGLAVYDAPVSWIFYSYCYMNKYNSITIDSLYVPPET